MTASKMSDVLGCQAGWAVQQQGLQKSYAQSEMKAAEAWVCLPRAQWKTARRKKFKKVAVRLRLALYGHPCSGAAWERQSADRLASNRSRIGNRRSDIADAG